MRISLAQVDIIWENAQANMQKYKEIAASLKGKSDLLVLPEMCANGFGRLDLVARIPQRMEHVHLLRRFDIQFAEHLTEGLGDPVFKEIFL